MNRESLCLAAALAAAVSLAAPAAAAQGFESTLHARALAAAGEGPHALRAFIQRTRAVHMLDYRDYAGVAARAAQDDFGADTGWERSVEPEPQPEGPSAAEAIRAQIERDMLHE